MLEGAKNPPIFTSNLSASFMINADQVALRAFHYKSTPTELCLPFGTNSLVIELRNKQGEITQESIVDACSIIDDYIFQLTIREFQARAENFLPGIMLQV